MKVASLELCKELYELSGWKDVQYGYFDIDGDAHNRLVEYGGEADVAPAYPLGYLLRKLEVTADWTHGRFDLSHCYTDENGYSWVATYNSSRNDFPLEVADTPEDAAAKLAIELFKQGILK